MSHAIRKIELSEFTDWRIAVRRRGFNEDVNPEDIERLRTQRVELDRLYGAFDGQEIVGTGGIDSYNLTVPGGTTVPAAGVAYITTSPTHRRRGILRQMMATLEKDACDRDEPVAILWAAQSGLYDRFGYGMATVQENWRIATEHSVFVKTARPHAGTAVRLVEADEAHRILPLIYERRRRNHPGFVDVSKGRWEYALFDAERVRAGASGYFFAIAEREGQPEGYAVYRIKRTGDFELSTLTLSGGILGLIAVTEEADAALWRFIFDMDLVDTVTIGKMPPDDPTWWRLVDPRRLQRHREDGMWLKLLDPARALAERRYSVEGRLVIETHDGDQTTTYELEGGPAGAECRVSHKSPDLSMRLPDLSSAYLGEARFATMTLAGRARELEPGKARLADMMLGSTPRPWSPYFF